MWTTDTHLGPSSQRLSVGAPHGRRLSRASDDRLARLVGDGSEAAFAALYERYHQRLYRYCRSMLHNDADAQDALQSAFAGAFAALAQRRRDAPMRPWLYRIAYNESVSLLRRRRPEVALIEAHGTPTASAEEEAAERARLAMLVADLAELAERQRGALVMRELAGLSHEEIALVFGISAGAAKQTIFEARSSLAEFAQGRAMGCEEVCRAVSDGNGRALRGRKIRAHLRDCAACTAFAAAIPARSRDLRAIAPPLSAVAATSLLRRALGTGSGHALGTGSGHGGGAGVAAGAATKTTALVVAAKTITGVAVIATAAVGVTGVVRSLDRSPAKASGGIEAAASVVASGHRQAPVSRGAADRLEHRSARVLASFAGARPRHAASGATIRSGRHGSRASGTLKAGGSNGRMLAKGHDGTSSASSVGTTHGKSALAVSRAKAGATKRSASTTRHSAAGAGLAKTKHVAVKSAQSHTVKSSTQSHSGTSGSTVGSTSGSTVGSTSGSTVGGTPPGKGRAS